MIHQNWPSILLHNFGWFLTTLLFLFASIDLQCPPLAKNKNTTRNQRIAAFCWIAFPANICMKNANSQSFVKDGLLLNECAKQMEANHANCGASVAAIPMEPPFEWVRKKSMGNGRKPRGKTVELGEKEDSFFFQMDEVTKTSREKEPSKKSSKELRLAKSKEHRKDSRSAERRRPKAKPDQSHTTMASSTPKTPTTLSRPTTTANGVFEERKRKSASRETTRQPNIAEKSAVVGQGHHNLTLSSHHHHKKGQFSGQGQKRGGVAKPGNWHELSSSEQSIAMMLRCQDLESRELLPAAVTCRNLRSDKVCNYLFHEVDRKTGRRDVKCNLQGLEDIAESCRKTCGICCEDINFACEDDKNGIIDCTRQIEKCHQKKWFGVLSRFCAGSCGLCAMTTCRDFDNSCRVRKALCLKPDSVDYMRENCARTCGFCVVGEDDEKGGGNEKKTGGGGILPQEGGKSVISGKPVVVERPLTQHRLIVPECTDKASNCSTNAHLCGSQQYGEYMIKFCTKTCLKCGQPHAKSGKESQSGFPVPPPLEVVIQPMLGETEKADKRVVRKCEDHSEKCAQWKTEGLCKDGNVKFTQEQRTKMCAKTCGHC